MTWDIWEIKKTYVWLFSTVIMRKKSVIMSRVISQSRNIPECDRLQLYHRYPGPLDRFQCLCLCFPSVNNSRIRRLEETFGHALIQPPLLTGARAACPAHCGSEFSKDGDLTAPLGNLFYCLIPLPLKIGFGNVGVEFLIFGIVPTASYHASWCPMRKVCLCLL